MAVLLARALNEVALRIFKYGKDAYKIQRRYMRTRIPIGNMEVRDYTDRLDTISSWLKYFPVETNTIDGSADDHPSPLEEDELMDLLHFAQPVEWNIRSLQQGNHGFFESLDDMKSYYTLYQEADKLQVEVDNVLGSNKHQGNGNHGRNGNGNGNGGRKRKQGRRGKKKDDESIDANRTNKKPQASKKQGGGNTKKACPHCGKFHKLPWSECWALPANKDKKPEWFTPNAGKSKQQTTNAIEEGHTLIKSSLLQKLVKQASKRKAKLVIADSDEEDSFTAHVAELRIDSDDEDSFTAHVAEQTGIGLDYMEELRNSSNTKHNNTNTDAYSLFPFHTPTPPAKRSKSIHYTAEVIVELVDCEGQVVPVRALLDTGTSATIVLQRFVRKGTAKTNPKHTSSKNGIHWVVNSIQRNKQT